jgi:hypothetical protein
MEESAEGDVNVPDWVQLEYKVVPQNKCESPLLTRKIFAAYANPGRIGLGCTIHGTTKKPYRALFKQSFWHRRRIWIEL